MGIKENKIRCKKCGEIIESKNVHDYVTRKCSVCAVDGGHVYLRRSGYPDNWEDLSIFADDEEK